MSMPLAFVLHSERSRMVNIRRFNDLYDRVGRDLTYGDFRLKVDVDHDPEARIDIKWRDGIVSMYPETSEPEE